jgi:gamma-glutamyltranspeptidase/glutathione hydrolase
MQKAEAGRPPGAKAVLVDDPALEPAGTTHVAIVDREGNAVSLTSSIEWLFGSRQMVRGFLLNNQLTDFNMAPAPDGSSANDVAPGKRPRSAMAPVIVFDRDGRVEMVAGSAGGSYIIGYVAKALVATLDWNLDPQAAIDLPNVVSRNGPTEVERGTELERVVPTLKAMGHDVRAVDMASGTHVIRRSSSGWLGGADPRREGLALGH